MLTGEDRQRHAQAGFTLVELLVVMVIMGIIGAFTMSSLVQGLQTSNEADRRVQALTDLQQAGQRVSRELRMACHVEAASPGQVSVDILRDTPPTRYRYTFSVDATGTLTADVDTVASDGTTTDYRTQLIAEDIDNAASLFTYRDSAGVAMPPASIVPSQVRDITLTLERAAPDDRITWSADLHLRNGGLSCGF